MYSQYQQYRQPTATVTVTQQPGTVLNSASWTASLNTASPVETYTAYYNGWTAKEQAESLKARTLLGEQKAEAERQAAWAKYYADQSSRAAHHFYNSPGTAFPHGDLPPAPPPSTTPTNSQYPLQQTKNTYQQQYQHQYQQQPNSTNDIISTPTQQPRESPDGLKQYVHRCLSRCNNKEQLEDMQKEVEVRISAAVQAGTIHTTNWETCELIPLFINSSKYISTQQPALPAGPSKNNNNNNNHASGYYGPSSSQPSAAVSSYYYENPLQHSPEDKNHAEKVQPPESREDTIYYGNSTTSTYNANPMSGHGASIADKRAERKAAKLAAKLAAAKSKLEVAKANKKRTIDNAVGFEQSSDTMAKRANRFSGAGGISDAAVQVPLNADLAKYMGKTVIGGSNRGELDEEDYVRMTVKGTCVRLEKEYLRLTAPPKSELVRPQGILEQYLQNLLLEWSGPKHRDYVWFCSQLKAIRQDMTVQRIFNGFAVEVYEAHARIALEQGDLNEYNQCQTQLKDLYTKQGNDNEALKNRNEFIAYRLIYYVHQTGNKKYEGGSSDLFKIMLSLTLEQREDSCISHALKVRAAIADFDYHSFWRLLASCPKKHGVYLMKFMIPNVRYWALQRVCKAYRPSVSLNFVLQELGFDAADEGKTWLESCGVVIAQDEVVTKDSVVQESNLKAQNSLI